MPYSDPEKNREYQREWAAKRRAAFFEDKQCSFCGSTENLELDHIDRSKKLRKIDHNIWTWSLARRDDELKKCQVLCKDCHWQKTLGDLGRTGHSAAGYRKGCRCEVCVAAMRFRWKIKRQNRKERAALTSP